MPKVMFVIHNPTAGRRNAGKLWAVLDCLMDHGVSVRVLETRSGGHATELARYASRSGADVIVAAGGDGTIAETVAGMTGSAARLGIIPLGTANVLAHEFGLPSDSKALAVALTSAESVTLWPGLIQGADRMRLFVQMVGVGFDAHVVDHIDPGVKRCLGRGAYVLQTLRELSRYSFPSLRVSVDGMDYHAAGVIVSKGRFYGGPYLVAPDALPVEPGFSVLLFENGGAFSALRAGLLLPCGKMTHLPGLRSLRASCVEITAPEGLPVQADGDSVETLPVSIRDAPEPVRLVVGTGSDIPAAFTLSPLPAEHARYQESGKIPGP